MSILNVNTIQPIGSGTTVTVAATELKTSNFITVGTGASITSPSANVLTLGTNTAERLRIASNGNIGIGSDNPGNKLDVAGDVKILDNSPRLFFYDANANGASSATGGFEVFDKDGNKNVFCGAFAPNADNLIFGVTGTERLRITSGGVVGINTDASGNGAGAKLVVGGRIQSNAGGYWFAGANGAEDGWHVQDSGGNLVVIESGVAERLRITNSGQITTKGSNNGNPVGIEIRNNNTNAYSHAELALTSQNATTSKIWCDVPNSGMRLNYNGGSSVKIDQSGNLHMPNGAGIDFSATGNSSGTMTSELLDDYEEGTWTPNFTFNGNSTGLTYSNRGGLYTRVGRLVTCYCMIVLSAKGSSTGNVLVTGLPYTATDLVAGTAIEGGGLAIYQDDTVGTHTGPIQVTVINNQSYFELYRVTSTNPGHSDNVTNGNVANNSSYRFVLQYTAV